MIREGDQTRTYSSGEFEQKCSLGDVDAGGREARDPLDPIGDRVFGAVVVVHDGTSTLSNLHNIRLYASRHQGYGESVVVSCGAEVYGSTSESRGCSGGNSILLIVRAGVGDLDGTAHTRREGVSEELSMKMCKHPRPSDTGTVRYSREWCQ